MHLSDSDRGRLDKAIDHAVSLAPNMTQLANSSVGKDILLVSNGRDFVLGSMLTHVMTEFIANSTKREFSEDEQFDIYFVTLRRLYTEIGILKVTNSDIKSAEPKTKKPAKSKTTKQTKRKARP